MPEKSGFFDTTADDPREYPAREFAEYFAQFIANGVFSGGTKLKVTATGADANVMIDLGTAWINGYQYKVFDSPLVLPIVPATTQDRIDRIILRLDTSTPVRAIKAVVLQGLPSGIPSPPAIVRSGDIYDLSLAQVLVKANTTIILPENITDERLNNAVCGLVTGFIQQADTTLIFNQFQAWLNTKTAQYQQQWADFMQSVQDKGFATTEYVDNRVLTGGYGVTTNSGNAYSVKPTPAPTALAEGLRVTVRINAANTGAATLNVNGLGAKSILKGNGNTVAAGNLKANSVYTLVYSGSAFILQAEGGEYGTAVAADVLAGKTIGTDSGIVTGTMPNRGAGGTVTPGTTNQSKAAGYYSSAITILGDADLMPTNIKRGVDIFGVLGTLQESTFGLMDVTYTDSRNYNSSQMGAWNEVKTIATIPRLNTGFLFRDPNAFGGSVSDGSDNQFFGDKVFSVARYRTTRGSDGASYIGFHRSGGTSTSSVRIAIGLLDSNGLATLITGTTFGNTSYRKYIHFIDYDISRGSVIVVIFDNDSSVSYPYVRFEAPLTPGFNTAGEIRLVTSYYSVGNASVSGNFEAGLNGRIHYN